MTIIAIMTLRNDDCGDDQTMFDHLMEGGPVPLLARCQDDGGDDDDDGGDDGDDGGYDEVHNRKCPFVITQRTLYARASFV